MSKIIEKKSVRLAPDPTVQKTEAETAPAVQPGLCRVCTQATDCTFPRDPLKPVTSCDEFTGVVPRKSKRAQPRYRKTEQPTVPYAGLCRYCSRVSDCTFPKPATGVWHCDEYA